MWLSGCGAVWLWGCWLEMGALRGAGAVGGTSMWRTPCSSSHECCSYSSVGTTWTTSTAWNTPSTRTAPSTPFPSSSTPWASETPRPNRQPVVTSSEVHVQHGLDSAPPYAPRHSPGVGVQLSDSTREAGGLAGRLSFLTQAVFGAVGRSALQPVYARSHNTQTDDDQSLSAELRSALYALAHMLNDIKPRFLPNVVPPVLQAVMFADAYVKTGERLHKADHVPHDPPLPAHARDDNGWGYVVRIGEVVYFDHGTMPRSVLDAITSRRAFIHALEVYAQLMAFFTLAERVPSDWLAFIDNTAGEAALKKGYGKDAFVNACWPPSGAQQHGAPGDHSSPESNPKRTWPTPCHVGTSPAHTARVGPGWTPTLTPSPQSWSRRPRTQRTPPRTPWTTSSLSSTEPARCGGRRAEGAGRVCRVRPARCLPVLWAGRRITRSKRFQNDVPL